MAGAIVVEPDDLFAILLNEEVSVPLRGLVYYQLMLAFHFTTDAKIDPADGELRLYVPKLAMRHFRRAAATKLLEATEAPGAEPRCSSFEEDVRTARLMFEINGGLEGLRYVPSVRSLEKEAQRAALQMRHIGRVVSIQLRSKTAPDREAINPTNVLAFTEDPELYKAFRLLRRRKATFEWRKRLADVLPFAHLVYVTSKGKRSMGRLPRLTSKRFIKQLCEQVTDRSKILVFIARYEEIRTQLNQCGYKCRRLSTPPSIGLPHVMIEHEPWPASLMPEQWSKQHRKKYSVE